MKNLAETIMKLHFIDQQNVFFEYLQFFKSKFH